MNATFTDRLNIISKLTWRRVLNMIKLTLGYIMAKYFKVAQHYGMPMSIAIEPTTSCNLRCPECPSGLRSFTRPRGMLNPVFFEKLINELAPTLQYLTFYFQGEPYLNPNFLDMVAKAVKKNIYTATSTNAHYLDDENARRTVESGLDRLIISIDGTTQETYEQYRIGGQLSKVISGTQSILKWKKQLKSKTPHVIFQFLVVKPNEHQIDDVLKLADEIGVDEVRLKTAQIYDYVHGSPLIPENEKYSRYVKRSDGTYTIKNKYENHCWKMWQSCVITWDGKVVPCCFDKDAHYDMGNLQQVSFSTLWHSAAYKAFRSRVLTARDQIEMCRNCTEGTPVWA
jgi:radical SAM protein with 4Fe4S-binding SPASM domain